MVGKVGEADQLLQAKIAAGKAFISFCLTVLVVIEAMSSAAGT